MDVHIKNEYDIGQMRKAGRLAAQLLNEIEGFIEPGVSTLEVNDFAHEFTLKNGAESAPLGYKATPSDPPFPKSICTSPNNVVCHGIPSKDVILQSGDIVNCDVTVKLNGYHGDTSRTFFVGMVPNRAKKLAHRTQRAMYRGIEAIRPGGCISDIGNAIQNYVGPYGYGIVRDLTGHGIGLKFHEPPSIFHYKRPDCKLELKPGMIFTVEPMLNLGSHKVGLLPDGWTIVTSDGKLSAQFEHTVLVTDTGYEILTKL